MRNQKLFVIAASILLAVSCAKKEQQDLAPPMAPVVLPTDPGSPSVPGGRGNTTTTTGGTVGTGAVAPLNVVSKSTLEEYAGQPLNNPTNVNLYVDLNGQGTSTAQVFGGTLRITYDDVDAYGNKQAHEGNFVAGQDTNQNKYNKWYNSNGIPLNFKGFFQDLGGGIILFVNSKDDNDLLGGAVYFRNFNMSVCTNNSPYFCGDNPFNDPRATNGGRCWFISLGPYNCQDFLVNNVVTPSSFYAPTSLYTKLGEFTGLNGKLAFK